jgi:hypothetical protein
MTTLGAGAWALAAAPRATSLIFHPANPKNSMFDTWLLVQNEPGVVPFYLNYLSNCDASCGGPYGDGQWNGVGAAVSMDGVHFADEGVVIHKVGLQEVSDAR